MTLRRNTLVFVALTALLARGLETEAKGGPPAPAVEIYHIPQEDLPRAPGYSNSGVFLPLSDLLELAEEAQRLQERPLRERPVCCTSLYLKGALQEDALGLEGQLAFEAAGEGWSATPIDDGAMPWTAQQATSGTLAFLARLKGGTYLFAKGPAKGTLSVKALLPAPFRDGKAALPLGRIYAPCCIEASLPLDVQLASSTAPSRTEKNSEKDWRLFVWPASQGVTRIDLSRKAPLSAPSSLRVKLRRTVKVLGAGLEIRDDLTLEDRFCPGSPLQLSLPRGLRLLQATTKDPVDIATADEAVTLSPRKEAGAFCVSFVFAAPVREGKAALGAWDLPAVAQESVLTLHASQEYVPLLTETPRSLFAAGGTHDHRQYESWGPLGELQIALARATPALPPRVTARLQVKRGEAAADYTVTIQDASEDELIFFAPPEWSLTDLQAFRDGAASPCTIQEKERTQWRVAWDPNSRPQSLRFSLRRVGAWGAPGTVAELELPLVRFAGPRPADYEILATWPEELEGRAAKLSALSLIPATENAPTDQRESKPNLALRAAGKEPRGALEISGRNSEVRATVVTALSLAEDRAKVRALLDFQVRLAPANTFRFVLPAGVGPDVRIEGQGIRESTLRSTPEGDEWTLVTQLGVLGSFRATLEWPLAAVPATEPVAAPQIRIPGVASQQGFVVLEGSAALRLTAETQNLAETDLAEVPPLPWPWEHRVLAVYRYVEPPFALRVKAEQFRPEPGLEGLVREAKLTTTFSPDGTQFTVAEYVAASIADRQFFEVQLPRDAEVWSVLVNGEGVKPARRTAEDGAQALLAPLPAARAGGADFKVSVLYREKAKPLAEARKLDLAGPALSVPVNRTLWNLNLPPGFEFLSFGGGMLYKTMAVHEPLLTFLRAAHYPDKIVFLGTPILAVAVVCVLAVAAVFLTRVLRKRARRKAAAVARRAPKAPSAALRLIGWILVIGFALFLLAAIVMPNFLEAQSRSKVSRVKADQRSVATALEAYFVDYNGYPPSLGILWQGPVKYMPSGVPDPFASAYGDRSLLRYVTGPEAFDRAARAGYALPPEARNPSFWMMYSVGPDGRDDEGQILYDPSNGTTSAGDVIRLQGGVQPFSPRYTEVRQQERRAGELGLEKDEKARRALGDGSGPGAKQPAPSPQTAPPAAPQKAAAGEPTMGREPAAAGKPATPKATPTPSPTQAPQSARGAQPSQAEGLKAGMGGELELGKQGGPPQGPPVADLSFIRNLGPYKIESAPSARRDVGLLSLSIELPEGETQRSFEALGGQAQIEVRLLETSLFKRLRFAVWIGALLLFSIVWLVSRRAYRILFILTTGLTLLFPVAIQTPWTVFFNTAFFGALLSLIVCLLTLLWKRVTERPKSGALLIAGLAFFWMPPPAARAEEGPGSRPVRIIAPYSDYPVERGDLPAFISQEDFSRLWKAARPDRKPAQTFAPILAGIWLDGSLSSDASTVRGVVKILAANPNDRPTSMALSLAELALENPSPSAPGAALESRPDGLRLLMEGHWAGTLEASFALPCQAAGAAGRLRLDFPEAAAGEWRIRLPYRNAMAKGAAGALHLRQLLADATVVLGPVRPGPLEVNWAPGQAERATAADKERLWRADVQTTVTWNSLARADWLATVRLEAEGGGFLPPETRFRIDPGLRILATQGDKLVSATVSESEIVFQLAKTGVALIRLEGILASPSAGAQPEKDREAKTWKVAGLRAPEGFESSARIQLEISDQIEILSIEPKGLASRPAEEQKKGRAVQAYDAASPDWSAQLSLRRLEAAFKADVAELFSPQEGLLRQAASIVVTPRGRPLRQILIEPSEGVRARSIQGEAVSGWTQGERTALVSFDPPVEKPVSLQLIADSDLPSDSADLRIEPLRLPAADEVRRSIAIALSPDYELVESDLAGATPRAPGPVDQSLASLVFKDSKNPPAQLRAYALASDKPARFQLSPIEALSRDTVFNRVVIAEGRQSLTSVLRSEPRRGRLRELRALLSLAQPDPAAASRLQAFGPVRNIRTESISDSLLRVVAELQAPQSQPVEVRFQLDQRADTGGDAPLRATLLFPEYRSGARAFLLLRRAFEGELTVAEAGAAQAADPSQVAWPSELFRPLPSDQAFELPAASPSNPTFSVTRHARDQALRAIVEVLRQRTIVTADGFERNELEIVLQNQSEQFLKIAFPHAKPQISVYEVQVASRVVKPTFAKEDGQDVLLVPLIRTGLLEPELSIRVAYTVKGLEPFKGRGKREQKLPQIRGGVPIAESALVLMLPANSSYSDFRGTLKQVELVDLEVDEALRDSKRLQSLSEAAMLAEGALQQQALFGLQKRQSQAASKLEAAKKTTEAQARNVAGAANQPQAVREQKLGEERRGNLIVADQAQTALLSNIDQLGKLVQQQQAEVATAQAPPPPSQPPPKPAAGAPAVSAPLAFPRSGDVFVFRQLQGVGSVAFQYASRELAGKRTDVVLGLAAMLAAAVLPFLVRFIFASRRKAAIVVFAVCLVLAVLRVAVDLAIPGMAVAVILLMTGKKSVGSKNAEPEALG